MEHDLNIIMIFIIKYFDPYNVFLYITTNIPCDSRLVLCSRDTYKMSC